MKKPWNFLLSCVTIISMTGCSSEKGESGIDSPEGEEPATETVEFAEGDSWSPAASLPEGHETFEAIDLTAEQLKMIDVQNNFSLDLFCNLSRQDQENCLLSPVSLSLNLSMLANGAAGETLETLARLTGSRAEAGSDDLDALSRKLIDGLVSADKSSRLSIANSLWIDNAFEVAAPFINRNCDSYYAEIFRRSLWAESTKDEINAWAERKTEGLIRNLIDEPLPGEMRMTLVNALYFYGAWVNPFDKEFSYKSRFTCIDGEKTEVTMMDYYQTQERVTARGELFSAAYLPFGNGAFNVAFILPDEGVNLERVEESLTAEELRRLESTKKVDPGNLMIPRFEMTSKVELRETLSMMGYDNIFSPSSDFSRINPVSPLWIDDIVQKAVIKFDEEGAEGAAVTYEILEGALPGIKIPTLNFNRPFIFVLTEKSSGSILFMGDVKRL